MPDTCPHFSILKDINSSKHFLVILFHKNISSLRESQIDHNTAATTIPQISPFVANGYKDSYLIKENNPLLWASLLSLHYFPTKTHPHSDNWHSQKRCIIDSTSLSHHGQSLDKCRILFCKNALVGRMFHWTFQRKATIFGRTLSFHINLQMKLFLRWSSTTEFRTSWPLTSSTFANNSVRSSNSHVSANINSRSSSHNVLPWLIVVLPWFSLVQGINF